MSRRTIARKVFLQLMMIPTEADAVRLGQIAAEAVM